MNLLASMVIPRMTVPMKNKKKIEMGCHSLVEIVKSALDVGKTWHG